MTWAVTMCSGSIRMNGRAKCPFPAHWTLTFRGRGFHLLPSIHLFPPRNDSGTLPIQTIICPRQNSKADWSGIFAYFVQLILGSEPNFYKTLVHWVNVLALDWKDNFNKDNSQLNKEVFYFLLRHTLHCMHVDIQSTKFMNWQNFSLILIPDVSQHTCGPSAFNTIGLCMFRNANSFCKNSSQEG